MKRSWSIIWIAYRNSLMVLVVGTVLSVALSAITAYPLSRRRLHGRGFFSMVVFFTMLFSGGTIPLYLQVANLGLLGALGGGLQAASVGIAAAVLFGLLAAVFSKPKDKS